jgi:lysyl-tRNA synthetase class 2
MSGLPAGVVPVSALGPAAAEVLAAGRVRLATGRVRPAAGRVRAGPSWQLGDALRQVELRPVAEEQLAAGDLLVVRAAWDGQLLSNARSVWRRPLPEGAVLAESTRQLDGGLGRALELRAQVLASVRRFFAERGYMEVETPTLVPSPGLDLHLDAFTLADPVAGRPAHLSTSPEYQMKRLLSGGVPRIVQITRAYRRGEHGSRHNPEFTMLEWYRAWSGMAAMMDETEQLVRQIMRQHAEPPAQVDVGPPFERMAVLQAFERFAGLSAAETLRLAREDEEAFFLGLIERVEPGLADLQRPVFLHHFPASQASLARLDPHEPELCERFELYLGGIELCNGFGELTDPVEQRARLRADQQKRMALGKAVYPIDERFLAALAEGMPPSAGNALGVDRFVACCLGGVPLAQVQSFPVEQL